MSSKKHTPEQIVAKLRQVDVLTAQGSTVVDAVGQIDVTTDAGIPRSTCLQRSTSVTIL